MVFVFITWLIIAAGALACVYMLWEAWSRFPRRDFDDVVHFLHPVDLSLAESLLDPANEFEFRWKLSAPEFREAQRKRMELYLELVRRMAHNSKVLVEFSNEINGGRPDRPGSDSSEYARLLQQKAIEVRVYALLTLGRLHFKMWMFPLSLGQPPALPQLRKAGEVDGPRTYGALKIAATSAFPQLGDADLDALTRNL